MAHPKCSSCGAPVTWAVHVDTRRRSPIDADPSEDGNIVFVHEPGMGGDPEYRLLSKAETAEPATAPRFSPHFATCPNAKQHRKGGR